MDWNTDQVLGYQRKVSHPDMTQLCKKYCRIGYQIKGDTYYYFQVAEDAE